MASNPRAIWLSIQRLATELAASTERLELLLKDLTSGDRSPNELMRHLIVATGTDNICNPQFEEIVKGKFFCCK